jgi:hypothetical protein
MFYDREEQKADIVAMGEPPLKRQNSAPPFRVIHNDSPIISKDITKQKRGRPKKNSDSTSQEGNFGPEMKCHEST